MYISDIIFKYFLFDYGIRFAKYINEQYNNVNSNRGANHDKAAVHPVTFVSPDSVFVGFLAGG